MTEEESSYNSYENESYAYEIDGIQGRGMHPHHPHPHHNHIPADHLDSRGNSRLWHEPDYLPLDSDGAIPAVSTLGRGPRGTGLVVDCDEGEDKFYLTIRDDVLGEVQYQTENLHAGKVSAHQVKGTPQPGLPTKFYIDVTRDGITTSYPIVANPAAPGTRFYLLDRPVKQQKHRRLADAYECESDELTHYVRGRWNNFPPPRPGDCIFCIVQSCNKTKEYSLGIGIIYSNDNGHLCFFVRTILNTSTPWINNETGTWWVGNVDTNVVYTCIVSNVFFEMLDCEQEPKSKVVDNEDGTCDITLYLPKAHKYSAGYGMLYSDDQNLHEFSIDTNIIATIEYTDEAIAQALTQANTYTDETVEITNANILARLENLQDEIDNLDASGSSFSAGTGIEISEEHVISAEPAIEQANEYTDTEISKVQTEIDELSENLGSVYSAGDGISISDDNVISADSTIARTSDLDEARTELTTYIDEKDTSLQQQINNLVAGEGGLYTAGYGIEISNTNQISIDSIVLNQLIDNAITDAIKYLYWDDEGYLIRQGENTTSITIDWVDDDSDAEYRPESVTASVYDADMKELLDTITLDNSNNFSLDYPAIVKVVVDDIENYTTETTAKDNFITITATHRYPYYRAVLGLNIDVNASTKYFLSFYGFNELPTSGVQIEGHYYNSELKSSDFAIQQIFDDDVEHTATTSDDEEPSWLAYAEAIYYIMFEPSFKNARPTSLWHWFNGMTNVTTYAYLYNLDTSECTTWASTFRNCPCPSKYGLSSRDVSKCTTFNNTFAYNTASYSNISGWDMSNVTNTKNMYSNCSNLTHIDVSADTLNPDIIEDSTEMFHNCTNLVGGNGTKYSSSHEDIEYARIDTSSTPGYFTQIDDA